ncbi:hypothetical protein LPJ63_000670 [Coemansia sp. RSA 2711]|nr:hypothetical protein LPJ63_000670 [Coemansia sp. RSA 2711]KAJ1847911.1 hypothetical protein LPJ70_001295 [Coemansia sp. RSA 2708]KAJ2319602.1 hypothetical protein IWW52_001878 [Coemansia sp. RSA 2704]KAJ2366000.1 hypothetical protein H4S01_002941 [Coemansia sp. RSA 2610]KAJ2384951.1 hypothetical protein H4S02_004574 [Coemansia sp. RSA 2611]
MIQVHENIVYQANSNSRHKLDIYFPQLCPTMLPLIVYVHGGAWRTGQKDDFRAVAEGLITTSQNRLAVAVINYRLSTSDAGSIKHPGHLNDVMAAVKFLVTDQSYPGRSIVDRTRVFLVGHSAGAHLSTLMALKPGFEYMSSVQGVLGIGGIYDIPQLLKDNPSYVEFIDMAFASDEHAEASPHRAAREMHGGARHVKFCVVHSFSDELVGPEQSARFAGQLVATGYSDVTLMVKELGSHDGALVNSEFWSLVVNFILT